MLLGKVDVETPAHVVVHKTEKYEVWRYPAQVAATVHAADLPRSDDGTLLADNEMTNKAFPILARYIGVFRDPENRKPSAGDEESNSEADGEKVAMTAPVIMTGKEGAAKDGGEQKDNGEKVAMTAPVILTGEADGEKVAMTAPVIMSGNEETQGGESGEEKTGTEEAQGKGQSMTFLLPAKYTSVEQAPVPTNGAVKLSMVPEGRCEAVLRFSGSFNMESYASKADELAAKLTEDGISITGKWTYQGYNPPFTLPWLRRNEIHIPVDGTPYVDVEGTPKQD